MDVVNIMTVMGSTTLMLLLATLATSSIAQGARPTASLRYERGAGAERCPDVETIRSAVAARLGRSPWTDAAPRSIIVVIAAAEDAGLQARVELRADDGRIVGRREMSSPGRDCVELAAALQLAISIAIDPLSFTRSTEETKQTRQTQQTEGNVNNTSAAHEAAVGHTSQNEHEALHVDIGLGGFASVGSAPALNGGISLQARLRRGMLSVGLEGRIDLPGYSDIPGGQISASLLLAGAAGCVHIRSLFGCGLVFGGALRGAGHDVVMPARTTLPYAAAGLRAGLELPLYSVLSVRLQADLLTPLTRVALREEDSSTALWSTPPLSGAFGAAVAGTLR